MLWEHKLQVSVSTAFLSSPKLSQGFVLLDRNTEYMFFLFLLENTATRIRKTTCQFKMSILFAHAITMSTVHTSSVSPSSYTNTHAFLGLFSNRN